MSARALGRDRARRLVVFSVSIALALALAPVVQAAHFINVVVSGTSSAQAAAAVLHEGGIVEAPLGIVDGVAARVSEDRIAALSQVVSVTPDRSLQFQSAGYGKNLATSYQSEVGATQLWKKGVDGSGVTVALVDTGTADVADLDGQVVATADLSSEGDNVDNFGHGTFLAGLIAGNGDSSSGRYTGVAPGANILSVKVAGADGSTSLITVLRGLQIVDSSIDRFNVRVLLLALSSESPLPPEIDPLSRALRHVWADGVLVIVPAGNEASVIAAPGEDPVLLTIGSVNDVGTAGVLDDVVSEFSGRGPTRWGLPKPDAAAPGQHLVSLRAPGSTVDTENPSAVVEGSYFRGSGTSMASAVAAGVAALLLDVRPSLSPDQAKAILVGSANPIPAGDGDSVGAGVINGADAVAINGAPKDLPDIPIEIEVSIPSVFGQWVWSAGVYRWNARQWAALAWDARQWAARQWAAQDWAARQWAARQWAARQWAARQWAARQWAARQWAARQWAGEDWAARQWSARQWSAEDWSARQWSARQWSADDWTARQWSARQWSARQWSGSDWAAACWG